LVWASVANLREVGSELAEFLLLAAARVASFQLGRHELGPLIIRGRDVSQKRFRWRPCDGDGWKEGRTPVMFIEPETFGQATKICSTAWEMAVNKLREDQEALRDRIREVEVDHPAYAWLQETVDAMKPLDTSDFPVELLQCSLGRVSREVAIDMPMPDEFEPPVTEWLDRKSQQKEPSPDFKPKCLSDLVSSEGMKRLREWSRKALADLLRMRQLGSTAGRKHKEVCLVF